MDSKWRFCAKRFFHWSFRLHILLALLFLFPLVAFSEYRVYQLVLHNTETGSEKTVLSTFDHIQYKGYYYLGPAIQVLYDTSWMCWGNTNYHKPLCPKPTNGESAGPTTNSQELQTNSG